MSRIRPWLWIGAFRDTRDVDQLRANEIGAMLQLAAHEPHAGIETLYLAIDDGLPLEAVTLRRGLDFIAAARARGVRVLVACGAGISRSATFCIGALKEAEGLSLLEGFRAVRSRHHDAFPHPALWVSLTEFFHEPVPFEQVLEAFPTPDANPS